MILQRLGCSVRKKTFCRLVRLLARYREHVAEMLAQFIAEAEGEEKQLLQKVFFADDFHEECNKKKRSVTTRREFLDMSSPCSASPRIDF